MKIHEYQAKDILRKHGVPVPAGGVAKSARKAVSIAEKLTGSGGSFPVVIKSQVLVGGRGKAGGIKLASCLEEVENQTRQLLKMRIKGEPVRQVLVEQGLSIEREIYLGVVLDRARKKPVFMISPAGGVEIEVVAADTPEKILFSPTEPLLGLTQAQIREMAYFAAVPTTAMAGFAAIVEGLNRVFLEMDCSLAEINPLVVTSDGKVVAADAKINFDDNALYRHPDLVSLRPSAEEGPLEKKARECHLNYVKLDGRIGCIVNGAGLAMATMDIVKHFGGEPANFLDIGGGSKSEQVSEALKLVGSDPSVNTVFFNIFGGIVRCDLVAEGILEALRGLPEWQIPIVIRLSGTNEEKAREMLRGTSLIAVSTMSEGARKAVELSSRA